MSDQIVFIEDEDIITISFDSPEFVVVETQDAFFVASGEQGPAGAQGIPGPSGTGGFDPIDFAYGDASPALLINVAANKRVFEVRLLITEEFDGVGAALSIGTGADPDSLMLVEENDPSLIATYVSTLAEVYGVETAIYLTITPGAGASQGRGQVIFTIEN